MARGAGLVFLFGLAGCAGTGSESDGAVVEDTGAGDSDPQDTGTMEPVLARLELHALDLWAQPLPADEAMLSVTRDGQMVETTGWPTAVVELRDAGTYTVALGAALHEPLTATFVYDGTASATGLATSTDASSQGQGLATTHATEAGPDGDVAVHTAYLGLRHRWFSAQARPARRGNRIALYTNGEDAWTAVATDLGMATSQVHWATWWWTSDFEIVRDASTHVTSTAAQRRPNTILSRLEARPATKRILVNELPFDLTLDDDLRDRGAASGDRFEVMRQANETSGQLWFEPAEFRFADRVRATDPGTASIAFDAEPAIASTLPNRMVDLADWPLDIEFEHASYHQKFGTIDGKVAFVGGMNFQGVDWDTSEHLVFDPRRMPFDATTQERQDVANKDELPEYGPRRDYMTRIEGPLVQDAEDVFAMRWQERLDANEEYSGSASSFAVARDQAAYVDGIQAQITTTLPEPFWEHGIAESWFNAVSQAEDYLFIEDQYFRMPMVVDALIERMGEAPDLEVIVFVRPVNEWTDTGCQWTYQTLGDLESAYPTRFHPYTLRSFDTMEVLAIFDETEERYTDMDIHSKLLIVDDLFLSVGSANKNNRGLIYEGEMNVAVVDGPWVAEQRRRVVQGMLPEGVTASETARGVGGWVEQLQMTATWNQSTVDAWDDESGDLNLNGDPVPDAYQPAGWVYPLAFGIPDDCFIEGMGPDGS